MKHTKSGILEFKHHPGFIFAEAGDDSDYYRASGFLDEVDAKTHWLTDCSLRLIVLPGLNNTLVDAEQADAPKVLKYKVTVTIEPVE